MPYPRRVPPADAIAVNRVSASPTDDQTAALQTASEYLTQAGKQVVNIVLRCLPLDGDTAVVTELSNSILRSAAL